MTSVRVHGLTIDFPLQGVSERSLKKQLMQVAVGGRLGRRGGSGSPPVVRALSNVHLELRPGDRLGLIGPNGAGKTTLLRAMAGAYMPDAGSVEVEGRLTSLLDLNLGMDPTATGLENIRLRGMISGLSEKEIRRRTDEIAEFSGLGPFLAMPMKTYSSGMQARLAFAVATTVDPDVFLLDEWIAVGDAAFSAAADARLSAMVQRSSILVIASHFPTILQKHCNKVMRLEGGVASPVMDIDRIEDLAALNVRAA